MKATLYNDKGEKKSQIDLPEVFNTKIRSDLVQKYFEADKLIQPYATKKGAGMHQSASGTISHKRHDWKGHYGHGYSRIPRKTMWRRGNQFFWVGANSPGTRGGRKTHPPKGIGKEKKINKKEMKLAFDSAFASTASPNHIISRYSSIDKIDTAPFVISSLPVKTKDLLTLIKTLFKDHANLAFKIKSVRVGKGKIRGRKYKSNAGALIVISNKENAKFAGIDVVSTDEITISDLYPLGRLTIYTEKALKDLEGETK
jgi:large subunit ribosomal protein L4e